MSDTTSSDSAIPEAARRLERMLGTWTVSGTMAMGEAPAAVSGRWHFLRAADGHGILGEMETTIEGMGTMEEHELIGLDPGEGRIHMVSLNRFTLRDHAGDWKNDHTLEVAYEGTVDGRARREAITLVFEAGRMRADIVESVDGTVEITTALRMTRTE